MKLNSKIKYIVFVVLLGLSGLILITVLVKHTKQILGTRNTAQRHITLGVWTEGVFDPGTQTLHPEKLVQFEQLVQKKFAIAHYYRGWEALADPNLITQFATLRQHGWMPMLNVNPYYFPQCPASQLPLYKAIAQGDCDRFLHQAGKNLSKINQPFYLLFAWEMNNKDLPWSTVYSGSSPSDFIAAWQHIYTIFRQEKATNALFVFCPNTQDSTSVSYDQIYPGDAYVDWVGLDGYNWGTTQSWSQWSSFSGTFTGSYTHLTTIAPNKPMLIAEVNTTNQGGDKAQWYTNMFTQELPYSFPKIQAVVIFNEDKTAQEHVNWKVDVTSVSLQAFIAGVHSRYY